MPWEGASGRELALMPCGQNSPPLPCPIHRPCPHTRISVVTGHFTSLKFLPMLKLLL